MMLRHLGQMSPAMRDGFVKAGAALDGPTAGEHLEVSAQLTLAILKAARQRFDASQGDRRAYDTLCGSGRGMVYGRDRGASLRAGAVMSEIAEMVLDLWEARRWLLSA